VLRARKTLTPRFPHFFTDFEKKTDCFAVYAQSGGSLQAFPYNCKTHTLFFLVFCSTDDEIAENSIISI